MLHLNSPGMNRSKATLLILTFLLGCGGGNTNSDNAVLGPRDNGNGEPESYSWDIQTILTEGTVGTWTNLGLYSNGDPVIAHNGISTPYEIRLAEPSGTNWSDQQIGTSGRLSSIGLDFQNQEPVLAYFDGEDLVVHANGTSHEVNQDGISGDWPSLAVADSGRVMVSFQRCWLEREFCEDSTSAVERDLNFVFSDDLVNWTFETVEIGGKVPPSNSGFYTSMIENQGQPLIAYFNRGSESVKFAKRVGSTWELFTIDTVDNDTGRDSRPSLAQSSDGTLGVCYYDPFGQDLYYAESSDNGDTWTLPALVDRLGDLGRMSSLQFDDTGRPTIVYYDGTDRGAGEGLKIAWRENGSWYNREVARGDRLGQFPSLKFDEAGLPVVAFFDATNGDLLFATYTGTWPPTLSF